MAELRLRIHEVERVTPLNGWWVETRVHDHDTKEKTLEYRPIIGVVTLVVDNARGNGKTRICVPATAGQLFQFNYDALYGEGGIFVSQASQPLYHDYDFEIIGEMLRDSVLPSNTE